MIAVNKKTDHERNRSILFRMRIEAGAEYESNTNDRNNPSNGVPKNMHMQVKGKQKVILDA